MYATTRDAAVTYEPARTACKEPTADGGFFVPLTAPVGTKEDAHALLRLPFHDCIATLLNRLFDTELVGADVALCIGKRAVQLHAVGQNIFVLECWHDPARREDAVLRNLAGLLPEHRGVLSEWAEVAERAAVLYAAVGQLLQKNLVKWGAAVDVISVAGSLRAAASTWYARDWLAPIGRIVCACTENDGLWTLLHDGAFPTDRLSVPTTLPEADITLPDGLERLTCSCGGEAEVQRYLAAMQLGADYVPQEETLTLLRQTLYAEVISRERIDATVLNARSELTRYDAACHAALQNHRARVRSNRPCLLLSQYGER